MTSCSPSKHRWKLHAASAPKQESTHSFWLMQPQSPERSRLVHAIDGCARWVLMVGWIDQLYRNPANNIHLWSGSHNAHNSVGARRCNIHNLSWSFNEFQFVSECELCSHHGTTFGFDVILTVGVLGRWLRFQRATWWFHQWIRHLPSQQAGLLCWLLYVPLSC